MIMLSRRHLVVLIAAEIVATSHGVPAQSQVQEQEPADPVKALYATYGIGADSSASGFRDKDAAKVLSKSLLALYRRAVKSGNFDYDFFVQGQDFELVKPIEIAKVETRGEIAAIDAVLVQNTSDANGKPAQRTDKFAFVVKKEAGRWRIDDASHDGKSVRRAWQDLIRGR
jgi:ketosteroid isomerase-like protein